MAEESKDQKTEEASSKKIEDAEKKGNFTQSREVTSSFVLLASIVGFSMAGKNATETLMKTWYSILTEMSSANLNVHELFSFMKWHMQNFFLIIGPILAIIMAAGLLSNILQTGGLKFSLHPLSPKWSKLNPMKGFKRIFSKTSVVELFKSIFKISVVAIIAYYAVKGHWDEVPTLMGYGVYQTLLFMGEVMIEIMVKVFLVMLILAALDFAFQKFTYLENLRMTKQEVKDERKDLEGNPLIKQRIRTVQMEMTRRRMMSAVPEADVVITNPTHFSIAIKYDMENDAAPVVVAKGQNDIALRIREIAKENNIPLVEDKPLARTLYKNVDVGQLVPASLYKAVAEILAYVYKLKRKTSNI
jgi:flagellar biosynthetic protein FlhB